MWLKPCCWCIVILLIQFSVHRATSYILRLPCQTIAEFDAKRTDNTLKDVKPLATLESMEVPMCQSECIFEHKCKSFVITSDDTCKLFDKSYEDKRDNVSLAVEAGSKYYSTLYNETKIGPNCKMKSPCAAGQRCFDICQCPGFQCVDIDHCIGNPCKNGGACSSTSTGYKCSCPEGFAGVTCEFANITWIKNCGLSSFPTDLFAVQDKTECYTRCRGKGSWVAFYRTSLCTCYNTEDVADYNGAECTFIPAAGATWSESCFYTGRVVRTARSKWHCYYVCKSDNFKSATWIQSEMKCSCEYADGRSERSGSDCIAF